MIVVIVNVEERAELLAAADVTAISDVADQLIALHGEPLVISPPETALVALDVREPVESIRFRVGDVLVTRAEVDMSGHAGWAIRPGDDHLGALAAAICAAVGDSGIAGADLVDSLCARTSALKAAADQAEWADVITTRVEFEELD